MRTTQSDRVSRRLLLLRTVSKGSLIIAPIALGTCLLCGKLAASRQVCLEAALYVSVILIVLKDKRVATLWKALPRPYHTFLVTLVILLLGAQLVGRSGQTFPFVEWAMYSHQLPAQPQYFSNTAVLHSGQTIPLKVPRQFRSVGLQLRYRLAMTGRQIAQAAHALTHQALITQYETTLRTLAQQYNLRHADDPIRTIHVWRCTLPPTEGYGSRESIDCQLFWQVPLPREEPPCAP